MRIAFLLSAVTLFGCRGGTDRFPPEQSGSISQSTNGCPGIGCPAGMMGCVCSVNVPTGAPVCSLGRQGTWQFNMTVAAGSSIDVDMTDWVTGMTPDPVGGCIGWAIYNTANSVPNGSPDWAETYRDNSTGHWFMTMGSVDETPVNAVFVATPVVGTGYVNAPMGDPDYLLTYQFNYVEAQPGQGLQTVTIPGIDDNNSFTGLTGREGTFSLATNGGGASVLAGGSGDPSLTGVSDTGNPGIVFARAMTLYRKKGPVAISQIFSSSTTQNILLANNPRLCALRGTYSNTDEIFQNGTGMYLAAQPTNSVDQAYCLMPQ